MKKSKIDLSISIVSYNTKEALKNCLASVYRNARSLNIEVFVVDNASSDNSPQMVAEMFPQVHLICNKQNLFFTKAHNQALKKANGEFILILNSDTIIHQKTFQTALSFLKTHPEIGALEVLQLDKEGKIISTGQRFSTPIMEFFHSNILANFFKNQKLLDKMHYRNWDRKTSRYVDIVGDACLFTPKKILEEVEFFDERFLLFFTENDLCLRIKKKGFKTYHSAEASITHLGGRSLTYFTASKNWEFYEQDMLSYYKKYFGFFWWLILWLIYRFNWIFWKFRK